MKKKRADPKTKASGSKDQVFTRKRWRPCYREQIGGRRCRTLGVRKGVKASRPSPKEGNRDRPAPRRLPLSDASNGERPAGPWPTSRAGGQNGRRRFRKMGGE